MNSAAGLQPASAVGLVPLDRDLTLHALVSLPGFVAEPLALVTIGLAVRRDRPGVAWSAIAAGAASLAGTVSFLVDSTSPHHGGLFERLALWPGYLWTPVLAMAVLLPRRESASQELFK